MTGVPSSPEPGGRYEENRFFLRDDAWKKIEFSNTDQGRRLPAPPLQKPCSPGTERLGLPDGAAALTRLCGMPLSEAITRRESVRKYTGESFTQEELSALLWATQGVRKVLSRASALRLVPSGGARHAFETYLAVSRVEGLAPGLYRYLPFDGELVKLMEDGDIGRKAAAACMDQTFVASAAVTFLWTVIPARMEWRYDRAAHKMLAIDAGHVCQNLYLACTALGAGNCAIAAYDREACDRLLGVDGKEEFTIYIAPVGRRGNKE